MNEYQWNAEKEGKKRAAEIVAAMKRRLEIFNIADEDSRQHKRRLLFAKSFRSVSTEYDLPRKQRRRIARNRLKHNKVAA